MKLLMLFCDVFVYLVETRSLRVLLHMECTP